MSCFKNLINNEKKKWQCFVCGFQYESYEEYKLHIEEKHEEGREYISCPVCSAPVRDMRLHFKAKHPNRLLPKNVQYKTTVWNDFNSKGDKIKTKVPRFREGMFVSNKMNGTEVHYRSGYECEVYELLEQDMDVKAYYAEPFKIPYCLNGKWRSYIPDLKIEYYDNTNAIWEIKPSNQTTYRKNKAKWTAMEDYANNYGWEFKVITETEIGNLRSKVIKQRRSS